MTWDQKFVLKKSHFWKKANNYPKIVFANFFMFYEFGDVTDFLSLDQFFKTFGIIQTPTNFKKCRNNHDCPWWNEQCKIWSKYLFLMLQFFKGFIFLYVPDFLLGLAEIMNQGMFTFETKNKKNVKNKNSKYLLVRGCWDQTLHNSTNKLIWIWFFLWYIHLLSWIWIIFASFLNSAIYCK